MTVNTSPRRKRRKPPLGEKPGRLSVSWGYRPSDGEDLYFAWGEGCSQADARLLHYFLQNLRPSNFKGDFTEPCLRQQLEDRGYDIKTLRFTIQKKGM